LIYLGSDNRFKKTFWVTHVTFNNILNSIREDIVKDIVAEVPISPECRLAICLYRLGRGDYLYMIAELFGIGLSTVQCIVSEVCRAIVKNLWKSAVMDTFPSNTEQINAKIIDMEQLWQFPCAWGVVDGCHLPIVCSSGGHEARKEYHNFKNFYSIVMMAIVDAKDRFVWASICFPGNSHDSVILQSTQLWTDITENNIITSIGKNIEKFIVNLLILGDSAFPFCIWVMKTYGHGEFYHRIKISNRRATQRCNVSTFFYAKICSLLARRRSSQPVQRVYWPENVIDWLGKWQPICVMRHAQGQKLRSF
jgi:hypothetical protein